MIVWKTVSNIDCLGASSCGKRGCLACHQKKLHDFLKLGNKEMKIENSSSDK